MYPFDTKVNTSKFTRGRNTCKFIILHHTAGGTYEGNMKFLSTSPQQASCHFVIGPNGEAGKIGDPGMILWHAGTSERGSLPSMNPHSLGIEIVGSGEYNIKQLIRTTDLVEYLMGVFNIPKENVLRHSDITQRGDFSKKKILWDGRRPARKIDVGVDFFGTNDHFVKWRNGLTPKTESLFK